jgi:hypothetical protein
MAHQLKEEEIDDLAAQEPAETPADEAKEPAVDQHATLAYGAEGPEVEKLVNLLKVVGHATAANVQGPQGRRLTDEVLTDVHEAQAALGVQEAPEWGGVFGELVGPPTWAALYAAAGAKLGEQAGAGEQ